MVNRWEPGTQYDLGSVVEYEGHKYKIIQPHCSQGDWCPPVTPALWGRLSDDYGNDQHQQQQQQQHYQQPQQQQQTQWQPPPVPQTQTGGYAPHSDQKVNAPHEEQKKNWFDEHKQELGIAGGLLAGAGILGGGMAAWKHHEKGEEQKKAQSWGLQNWLTEAQGRADQYQHGGFRGGVTWILNRGRTIPQNAIPVGEERGGTLYTCRAFQDGGIQLGKASDVFKKGAVIGYKNEEIHLDTYEILVGDRNAVKWVDVSGRFNEHSLQGLRPVEGGRENDGTPLFIAQAPHHGATHPGKASPKLDGAYIPYDGKEKEVKSYRVLCYV